MNWYGQGANTKQWRGVLTELLNGHSRVTFFPHMTSLNQNYPRCKGQPGYASMRQMVSFRHSGRRSGLRIFVLESKLASFLSRQTFSLLKPCSVFNISYFLAAQIKQKIEYPDQLNFVFRGNRSITMYYRHSSPRFPKIGSPLVTPGTPRRKQSFQKKLAEFDRRPVVGKGHRDQRCVGLPGTSN